MPPPGLEQRLFQAPAHALKQSSDLMPIFVLQQAPVLGLPPALGLAFQHPPGFGEYGRCL